MIVIKKLDRKFAYGGIRTFALLECEYCGKQIEGLLQYKKNKSCGCATFLKANIKHNLSRTRQYKIWGDMIRRCTNKNNKSYYRYGGRGITYTKKWEKFEGFWEDMKEGYRDDLTLDRIDSNGNYCKENCRWADSKTQASNRNNAYTFIEKKEENWNHARKVNKDKFFILLEEYKKLKNKDKKDFRHKMAKELNCSLNTINCYINRNKEKIWKF